MDISFLLPTKNEEPELLKGCIESINSLTKKYSYEICVYSQKPVEGDHVKWYHELDLKGPLYGFNYLFKHSKGEYVICIVEDHEFISSPDNAIDFLKKNYEMSKYKVCSLSTNDGFPCGLPRYGQRLGSVLKLKENIPNCQITRFPVAERTTVNKYLNGYIFHPEFRYHAGDMWLGYYLYMMGEPSNECFNSRLKQVRFTKNSNYEVSDCNTFYALLKNFEYECKDYVAIENPGQSIDRYTFC